MNENIDGEERIDGKRVLAEGGIQLGIQGKRNDREAPIAGQGRGEQAANIARQVQRFGIGDVSGSGIEFKAFMASADIRRGSECSKKERRSERGGQSAERAG